MKTRQIPVGGATIPSCMSKQELKHFLTATILFVLFSGCTHLYGVTRYVNTMADPAVADGTMQFPL